MHVRAQQHHRAHFALGQQIADARRVAAHEIDLQLGEPVGRNRDLGELAEPGRHAVRDGALARRGARRPRARPARAVARCGAERDRRADRARPPSTCSSVSEFPSSTTSFAMAEIRQATRTIQGRFGHRASEVLGCRCIVTSQRSVAVLRMSTRAPSSALGHSSARDSTPRSRPL